MLIIFDFDGVLRSLSLRGLFDAYKAVIAYKHGEYGYKKYFSNECEFEKWFDPDWKYNLRRIGGFDTREDIDANNRIFHEVYDAHIEIFPWVESILKQLSEKHILALLSASHVDSVRKSLGKLDRFFTTIIGGDDVEKIKPHPEGIYLILEETGTLADDAIIVGDMEVDIQAGKSSGIKTVAVVWNSLRSEEFLNKFNPDYVFRKPEELLFLQELVAKK